MWKKHVAQDHVVPPFDDSPGASTEGIGDCAFMALVERLGYADAPHGKKRWLAQLIRDGSSEALKHLFDPASRASECELIAKPPLEPHERELRRQRFGDAPPPLTVADVAAVWARPGRWPEVGQLVAAASFLERYIVVLAPGVGGIDRTVLRPRPLPPNVVSGADRWLVEGLVSVLFDGKAHYSAHAREYGFSHWAPSLASDDLAVPRALFRPVSKDQLGTYGPIQADTIAYRRGAQSGDDDGAGRPSRSERTDKTTSAHPSASPHPALTDSSNLDTSSRATVSGESAYARGEYDDDVVLGDPDLKPSVDSGGVDDSGFFDALSFLGESDDGEATDNEDVDEQASSAGDDLEPALFGAAADDNDELGLPDDVTSDKSIKADPHEPPHQRGAAEVDAEPEVDVEEDEVDARPLVERVQALTGVDVPLADYAVPELFDGGFEGWLGAGREHKAPPRRATTLAEAAEGGLDGWQLVRGADGELSLEKIEIDGLLTMTLVQQTSVRPSRASSACSFALC